MGAPQEELAFYLSYAKSGAKIFEPLCGSGRFLVPFAERGFDITGVDLSEKMLRKLNEQLLPGGKLVFAVDTCTQRWPDDPAYKISASVRTKEGYDLILKNKNYYDPKTQTQFSPSIYELYHGNTRLQYEQMDFRTHLNEIGFAGIAVYSSFQKEIAVDDRCERFLYECTRAGTPI